MIETAKEIRPTIAITEGVPAQIFGVRGNVEFVPALIPLHFGSDREKINYLQSFARLVAERKCPNSEHERGLGYTIDAIEYSSKNEELCLAGLQTATVLLAANPDDKWKLFSALRSALKINNSAVVHVEALKILDQLLIGGHFHVNQTERFTSYLENISQQQNLASPLATRILSQIQKLGPTEHYVLEDGTREPSRGRRTPVPSLVPCFG